MHSRPPPENNLKATARSESRLVVMAPQGAEVYVDDERQGSIGRSGRVILNSIPPGKHILRVARTGEVDDERVIEIRPDGNEQIIQAQFKSAPTSEPLSPSRGGSLDSKHGMTVDTPRVVACAGCGSRFAEGIKFCGRCGNTRFLFVTGDVSGSCGTRRGRQPVRRRLQLSPVPVANGYIRPQQILWQVWNSDRRAVAWNGARRVRLKWFANPAAVVIQAAQNSAAAAARLWRRYEGK